MATAQAMCPRCGHYVDVPIDEIAVLDAAVPGGSPFYGFVCPRCQTPSMHQTSTRVVEQLARVGASSAAIVDRWRPPHPERPAAAPRLTADDLIDFHERLEAWGGPAAA